METKKGHILLAGGAEFGGQMAEPDLRAFELAGGFDAPLEIIPAAAAPDHNHERAGGNGLRWFEHLGVRQAALVPLIDRASANLPSIAAQLREMRFIYLLGGFPRFLCQTLAESLCWEAVLSAYQSGAVIGGSSAGATVLCEHFYDPDSKQINKGLNLVSGTCMLPHHNRFGKGWAARVADLLPEAVLLGIDEQTGMIDDAGDGGWRVYGKGRVTLY